MGKNRKNASIDVAVLLMFFNRPDCLLQVFEQIKFVKPSKLFLYQDGPRNNDDLINIKKCRQIVNNIDWECDVQKFFQEKNIGVGMSNYLAMKWAFKLVDKCIVLEDDDLPSPSFFAFCKELLDKYECDDRISMIAGVNHENITKYCPYDYFFTTNFSGTGWASWKRVINRWESNYSFMKDEYYNKVLFDYLQKRNCRNDLRPLFERHYNSKNEIPFFESIMLGDMILNHSLSIVPKKNLIKNIGYKSGAHYSNKSFEDLPDYLKQFYSLKLFTYNLPLHHPKYIAEDVSYKERVYKIMNWKQEGVVEKYIFLKRIIRKIKKIIRFQR